MTTQPTQDASKGPDLLMLSNAFSKGLGSFGEAQQFWGAASSSESTAGLLDMDAKMVLADSDFIADRMEAKGERIIGNQVATFAKAGVTMEGSPMKVLMESEKNIRLDILTMKNNAVRQANKIGFEALNQRLAAGRARTRAVQKIGTGVLKMATSYATAKG